MELGHVLVAGMRGGSRRIHGLHRLGRSSPSTCRMARGATLLGCMPLPLPSEPAKRKDTSSRKSHRKQASTSTVEAGGWIVDEARLKQYKDGFLWADTDCDGFISVLEAREFLETSGLPLNELSHVWHMSDVGQDGQLSLGEFICAMHLTFRRWQGTPLPPALPKQLAAIANHMPQPHTFRHSTE